VHPFTQYGNINPNDLANNNKRFNEPWDGSEPFKNVSEWFEDCIEFAWAALSPYSDAQIMNRATLVVYNTGLFYEELKKWDARPAACKSFEEFCDHIWEAQRIFCRQQRTSKHSDYGRFRRFTSWQRTLPTWQHFIRANNAQCRQAKTQKKAATDAPQKELIKALTMQVEMLAKQNCKILAKWNLPLTNFTNIPAAGAPTTTAPHWPKRIPVDEGSYCWSHGYLVTRNQASAKLQFPKDRHQKTATRINNMGSNQQGKLVAWQDGANEAAGHNVLKHIDLFVRTPTYSYSHAIFDSGTTGHYMLLSSLCIQKTPTKQPIMVTLPNGDWIMSTHDSILPFPNLPLRLSKLIFSPHYKGRRYYWSGHSVMRDAPPPSQLRQLKLSMWENWC
jgi:hypothetical protein